MAENNGTTTGVTATEVKGAYIVCNNCGKHELASSTAADFTLGDITENPRATINLLKKHFETRGWKTSWGHDLCPECK